MVVPPTEGSIDVTVSVKGGRIDNTDILNRRPIGLVGTILTGMEADKALIQMTRLFSVCRLAQGAAGLAAVEEALGIEVDEAQLTARDILVSCETVFEHAHRIILDWSALLGVTPDVAALKKVRAALGGMENALYPAGDALQPGGGVLSPDFDLVKNKLSAARAALEEAHLLAPSFDVSAVQSWIARDNGVAVKMLEMLKDKGIADFGCCETPLLHPFSKKTIGAALAGEEALAFAANPSLNRMVFETGPFARRSEEFSVSNAVGLFGRGLYARFMAICIDLSLKLSFADSALAGLVFEGEGELPRPVAYDLDATGVGVGLVDAARGILTHRVEILNGRIANYQTVAPTEWNFHPQGVLALGLSDDCRGQDPVYLAKLMVQALDPCVSCRIEIMPDA